MAVEDTLEALQWRTKRIVPIEAPAAIVRTPMRWTELCDKEPPARAWVVSHWLSQGVTLFAGKGGIGKTLVAQTLATALALGKNYVGAITAPKRVLFWACEDDHDELWRRQLAICQFFGASLSDLDGRLWIEPRLGCDNTLFYAEFGAPKWSGQHGELVAQVNDYQADVTFVDNVGQTFGGRENDRHHVTSFVNGLAGLAGGRPHSTVLLAHPGKDEASEFSGSTAWENAVRMRWYLGMKLPDQDGGDADSDAEDDSDTRYIAKRKTNYTTKDYCKLTYLQGVFRPVLEPSAFASRFSMADPAVARKAAEAAVLESVDKFVALQIRVIDSKTSPDYLPKKMSVAKLMGDFSHKEIVEAMTRLRMDGRIVEGAIGKFANRTVKTGLMRSEKDALASALTT